MLVDAASANHGLHQAGDRAHEAEAAGYDGFWTAENKHDPFLPLAVAAERTSTITLGTSIAVGFARSPMEIAHVSHDLHAHSGARFVLGLGSQVKAHVERRFSMPWSHPAPRMRELIEAVRAIWAAWDHDEALDFRGDFYTHTLMPAFFRPPPNRTAPPIYLAAVGEHMTAVAGEVADGLFTHPFTTREYLSEVTLPTVDAGASRSGRSRADVAIAHLCLIATGRDEQAMATAIAAVRSQVAFYGSTPAYRAVLDKHGWAALGEELHALSRVRDRDTSAEMAALVDDDVLHAIAIVAEPADVAKRVEERFGGLVDRITFYWPYKTDAALRDEIAVAVQAVPTPA